MLGTSIVSGAFIANLLPFRFLQIIVFFGSTHVQRYGIMIRGAFIEPLSHRFQWVSSSLEWLRPEDSVFLHMEEFLAPMQ